ncbi:ComF family protein [Desulfonema magnum]|uniref:Phosphoribosyl transferase domain-containing protein n=1 Tax=Desulfonema magnum TaxID=45655 RepID=A0A975BQ54_9BACT|nr:ComF family protein [Desulfonema magnum]QTA89588.1 Phosphoribosyl transferase domain-containing protein [Desulfonema magnum]
MPDFKEMGTRVARVLKEAIFPTKCSVCDAFFPPPQQVDLYENNLHDMTFQKVMAPFLCPNCLPGFSPLETPIYGKELIPPRRFRLALALGEYEKEQESFAAAIRSFKYNEDIRLARPFGMLLFCAFIRHWDKGDIDIVMPVPLHIRRLRKRGFNQAYVLIRKWPRMAKSLNTDLSHIQIKRNVLVRTKNTIQQATLKSQAERMENIKDAFSIKKSSEIKGKRILLVDDVYTTGATSDECAKVLLNNGAEYVDILSLAKTVKN